MLGIASPQELRRNSDDGHERFFVAIVRELRISQKLGKGNRKF